MSLPPSFCFLFSLSHLHRYHSSSSLFFPSYGLVPEVEAAMHWTTADEQQRNIYRYTGHQNTSKNLIRSHFASSDNLIISGSEDGLVYIWPRESSQTSDRNQSVIPSNNALPAYYPPRDLRQTSTAGSGAGSGIVVKPINTLEGHGEGAVFDVDWYSDGIVSAGEDGRVGVWGFDLDIE